MDDEVISTGRFSIPDYVIFAASLLASFGIGIYSSFAGKKTEKTTEDFYFGDHDMNIVAVAMSLAATFLSAIGLLGVPSEVYHNGISYSVLLIAETVTGTLAIVVLIPFVYRLRLTSIYEYFEHRFNSTIRRCACLLFITNMMLYMSIVLYAPALALSQVSGLPIWVSILTSGFICTVYTSLGGMKAVIWTDAFQMVVMLIGVVIVVIHGAISAGGVSKILAANEHTGRLDVSFSADPTVRHSFWALAIGAVFTYMPFSLSQPTVQRYLSVKNKRAAQKMMSMQLPTVLIWWSILIVIGATMFAFYQGCDPELAKRIERPDQMVAIFVVDVLGYLKGLPGLFTAVVYSATLSTVSSGVNSVVVVLTEDFIKPLHLSQTKRALNEHTLMKMNKGLSFLIGFAAIGLAFVSKAMGRGLIQFCLSIDGMCGGPMLGLFFCGMMLSYCNAKGAAAGVLSGLIVTFWIGMGAILTKAPQVPLPLTANYCSANNVTADFWSLTNGTDDNSTAVFTFPGARYHAPAPSPLEGLDWVYGVSYQWYGLIGFAVTVTVATIVSFATGFQDASKVPDRFFLYKVFSKSSDLKPEKIVTQFHTEDDFQADLLQRLHERSLADPKSSKASSQPLLA